MVVSRRGCLDHKNKVSAKVGSENSVASKRDLNKPDSTASRFHSRSNDKMEQPHMFPLALPTLSAGKRQVKCTQWFVARSSQLMVRILSMGGRAGTRKAQRPCKGLVSQSICEPNQPSSAIPDLTSSLQCKAPLSATRCPQGRPRAMQQSQEVTWLF